MKFNRTLALGLSLMGLTVNAAEPDVAKYFPAKTDAIISINIKNMLESDIVKKYALDQLKTVLKSNEEAAKAIEALGIDPLKDLDAAYVAVSGEQGEQPQSTIVLKGKFDAEKVNTAMLGYSKDKPEEVAVTKIGGKSGFKFTNKNQPQAMFGLVADGSTVILGNEKKDIESAMTAEKSALKSDLADLFSKANPKAAVTVVSWLKGKLKDVPVPDENAKAIIKDLELFTMEIKAAKDVDIQLTAGMATKDAADSLNQMLEGFLENKEAFAGLIAMQQPAMKPLGDVVRSLTAKSDGKKVTITAKMAAKVIDALLEKQ